MDRLIKIADGFWNVRGSFKIAGLLDVGTQTSLVKRKSGDFVLLDSYPLRGEVAREILTLTEEGRAISAILNLHPFHTLHVAALAQQFPQARLYGTRRHKQVAPQLAWQAPHTEDAELHAQFADDFTFSVPGGVEFSPMRGLHFASVLALHEASGTLHVDDTLTWAKWPWGSALKFHPTLRFVLQKRKGAAAEFRAWAEELIVSCARVRRICSAHMRDLPGPELRASELVRAALDDASKLLVAHERRYG